MSKKGQKSERGRPEIYNEVKKRVSIALTPEGVKGLDAVANSFGISRSELCERIGREIYQVIPAENQV